MMQRTLPGRRRILKSAVVFLLALGLGEAHAAATRATAEQAVTGAAAIAQLKIRYENGTPLNAVDFRGRALLMNFWAYWCPNCIAEFQSMQSLLSSLGGPSRLAILVVSDPKDWQTDRLVVHQRGIPFPLAYYDPNWTPRVLARVLFARATGATVCRALPVSYVFAPSGAPALALIGSEDWTSPQLRNFWLGLMSGVTDKPIGAIRPTLSSANWNLTTSMAGSRPYLRKPENL